MSRMNPQPHPLLHYLVRQKPTSTNVCLQVAKNVEVIRGKFWAVQSMFVFPTKSLKLISHQIGSMETELSSKRMIPSDSIPGYFDFMARRSTLSHQETNHISLFFLVCLHFQFWTNTLYTSLTSRTINNLLTCTFSLCMSPSLQMAVPIRNNNVANFCEECVLWRVFGFQLSAPHK